MVSWIYVCNCRESRFYFKLKDGRSAEINSHETRSLLAPAYHAISQRDYTPTASITTSSVTDNVWIDDDEEDFEALDSYQTVNHRSSCGQPYEVESYRNNAPMSGSSSKAIYVDASPMDQPSPDTAVEPSERDLFLKYRMIGSNEESQVPKSPSVRSILKEKRSLWPLCLALIITIWCSIFQASFFAHVDSANGWEIEQILYFTRLFCDLLGRPITRLPRPFFMKVCTCGQHYDIIR